VNSRFKYIESEDELQSLHSKTLGISGGGLTGFRDLHSLLCAIEFIQDDTLYPEFVDKLTHLVFIANKSHCFIDGNKRMSIVLGARFLLDNGYLNSVTRFIYKMEVLSYHLAAGRITKELLRKLLLSIITEEDYPEDLKIELLNVIDVE